MDTTLDNLFTTNKGIWDCFKEFNDKSEMILDESIDSDIEDDDNSDVNNIQNKLSGIKVNDDFTTDDNNDSVDNIPIDELLDEFEVDDSIYTCIDCKTYTLVYSEGGHVCTKCGVIQQKKLSEEAEYRNYADSNKNSNPERVGIATDMMFQESSLGTNITFRPNDNMHVKRMVQYNSWSQIPYSERSLYKICSMISAKSKNASLPTIIIDKSKEYYNIIKKVDNSRGSNRLGIIAACVYFACKGEGVPRSSKEIANIFSLTISDMTAGIKHFRQVWAVAKTNGEILNKEISNPIEYIDRYCSNLSLSNEVKHVSEFIVVKAIMNSLCDDNTSPSIASSSIYLACNVLGINITKSVFAESCRVSSVTISKCFKKLNEHKMLLLPSAIIKKYNVVNEYE
jgi:transcription initiation factor TFIIB